MTYEQYAKRAAENGIKLSVPISPEILNKLTTQSEIYDVIWASQASSKENLKTSVLSINVMGEIRRLAGELLLHPAFKKYSGMSEIEKRADRHYASADEQTGFDKRQDTIMGKLGLINKKEEALSGKNPNNNQIKLSGTYLPNKEDFESAYRMLTRPGEPISLDAVLNQIEINAKKEGHVPKDNWRMITERNIEIWSSKKRSIRSLKVS
jgi:hypothetical protein